MGNLRVWLAVKRLAWRLFGSTPASPSNRPQVHESGEALKQLKVFLDVLPSHPKTEHVREQFRSLLRERLEERLPNAVERIWRLPPLMLTTEGEYLALLLEARELYIDGHFYSCVAMCGIAGERLVKDLVRAAVRVEGEGGPATPPAAAFDQLERVDLAALIRFLKEVGLLKPDAAKAAEQLSQLRNQYAHARGKQPEADALRAVELLQSVVEDTVSMFKNYEIRDGAFVRRTAS